MSRLVYGRTKYCGTTYVCNSCLHPFCKKELLDNHIPNSHPPQDVRYSNPQNPKECVAEFRNKAARFRLPFYLVCDFESFLSPIHNDNDDDVDAVKATNLIDEHQVCGFACHRVSQYPQFQTDPVVYSGPNVMDKFYEHAMNETKVISLILANDQDMTPLTDGQQGRYDTATVCEECGDKFSTTNHKVRHHDHVSGQYLFPACNNCNLTLKMPNRKRKVTQSHDTNKKVKLDEQQVNKFFIPIVFHNLKSYDSHFVIKHFKKQYTARPKTKTDDNDKTDNHIDIDADDTADNDEEIQMAYGDIRVTPLNGEKYLSFQVGNLRFIDSFQFLSTSLENLVSLLLKSGRDKFVHTIKHLGDHDSVFAKGVYPYSYMTGSDKFGKNPTPTHRSLLQYTRRRSPLPRRL